MTAIENTTSFGYWIRRRRKALDLTQLELARLVGCSLPTIKKIEMDERRPSVLMAERLAECLEIPPSECEIFIRIARQQVSPERFTQKTASLPEKVHHLKQWMSRLEDKIENVIGDVRSHQHESFEPDDDASQDPDFGV